MSKKKVDILGVHVDSLTMGEAVKRIQTFIEERNSVLIATANAEMLMRATYDRELKNILNDAALVVPDGAGTVWAAHHLGHLMPERVAGYDLAQELMRKAPQKGYRLFFFGAAPGVAEKAKTKAEKLYPGIEVVGVRNGFSPQMTSLKFCVRFRRRSLTYCSSHWAFRSRRSGLPHICTNLPFLYPWVSAALSTLWQAS